MPMMSAKLSDALVRTTHARDIDDAFNRVFSEYLELKLNRLNQTIHEFEQKWGMDFEAFKQKIQLQIPDQEAYSFDTETDFWQWEEAVTLKEHLTTLTRSV